MKNRLVISLLAILVIVLASFAYLMATQNLTSPKTYEKQITRVETISESDDVDTIEADLNDTELDNLDTELKDIEAEIQ